MSSSIRGRVRSGEEEAQVRANFFKLVHFMDADLSKKLYPDQYAIYEEKKMSKDADMWSFEADLRESIAKQIEETDLESEAKEVSSDYFAATVRSKMIFAAIVRGK